MTQARSLPSKNLALGSGPEFDRIRSIIGLLGSQGRGLGDDCGLYRHGDEFLALSTDVSVQNVHFRLDWISLEEAGWRATAAALSDLAAEGAEPIGLLCAVIVPDGAPEAELLQLMSGVNAAARAAGSGVLGGDLSSGPAWSVAVTVVGRTLAPVTRGGAEAGDRLWVTGALGGARAALEAWRHHREPSPGARARFAHPEPRIAAGRWLAAHGATAMIDISDGIAGDAAHLAAASQLSVIIDLDSLPVAAEAEHEARQAGIPARQFAAEGGEDYELLAALPAGFSAADDFVRDCGLPLTRVGEAVTGTGVRFLSSGHPIELQGFSHFG